MIKPIEYQSLVVTAKNLLDSCRTSGLRIVTAESCTGGLIASVLTENAGSSDVMERGFVTYSNEAKSELLDIDMALIVKFGAVSRPVAQKMAEGALNNSRADISLAVTGIAGPGGGSESKPVGLVHFGICARSGKPIHVEKQFGDLGRAQIRLKTVDIALKMLREHTSHK